MKKLILLAAVLCIALNTAAAGADFTEQLVGNWYLDQIELEGVLFDAGVLGFEMQLTVNNGGTGLLFMDGESEQVSWNTTGNEGELTDAAGAVYQLRFHEDGRLILSNEESIMYFSAVPAEQAEQPDPDPDAVFKDYLGDWVIDAMTSDGIYFTMEQAAGMGQNLDMELLLRGDHGTIRVNETEADASYKMQGATLILISDIFGTESEELPLTMMKDGRVRLDALEMGMYFVRADSEGITPDIK